MPSRSKAQQRFMGMVHALKKGEMKPSDASPEVKKAADSMTKKSTKKYASTKHKGKPERVSKEVVKKLGEMIKQEVAKRDYKAEYKKFQSSTKMKKYRAELNKYNRQKGTYGNGDGKDASHKGGKIVGFEAQSKNRGRAEKSRLKKENMGKRCTVKEVSKWLKTLEEFRYRKVRNVDARRVAAFVNNGMNEEELPTSLQKKWEHKKYGREKHLANKYIETILNVSLKESVNERKNPKRERAKKSFIKNLQKTEKTIKRVKQFAKSNEWGAISSFIEDDLVYDMTALKNDIDTIISMPVDEATSLGADMLLGGIASVIKKAGMRPKTAKMMGGGFKVSKRDKVGFKIDVEIRGMDKKKTFPLQFETERGMLYVVIKNKPIKLGKYTMVRQAAQNLKKVGTALIGDKDVKRIA